MKKKSISAPLLFSPPLSSIRSRAPQMMPVAKATAITQVTDPSCELRPVIGLWTEGGGGLQTEQFWLAGWLVWQEAGAPAEFL